MKYTDKLYKLYEQHWPIKTSTLFADEDARIKWLLGLSASAEAKN